MRLRSLLILALLALACREKYDLQRDLALKQALGTIRTAIQNYRADNGAHPRSLEALVPKYLAAVPADPMTQQKNWRLTTEEVVQPSADFTTATPAAPDVVVVDVHSAAPGTDRDGVAYGDY